MRLKEAITTRQSVRSFTDDKVERADIERILASAVYAPSAGNLQPWQFVVLDDPRLIEQACRLNLDAYWGIRAPAAVVVCSNAELHRPPGFWIQSCAAVTQNLLLLAHDAGLGATWTGVYPDELRLKGIATLLNLPAHLVPFSLVLLGYPKRRGSQKGYALDGKVHYNRFMPSTRYSYTQSNDPEG